MNAIIVAEIDRAVEHEAEDVGIAASRIVRAGRNVCSRAAWRRCSCRRCRRVACNAGLLVADFGFKTERTEIITDDATGFMAGLVIDFSVIITASNVELNIFDDRWTACNTNIPRIVARHCRRYNRS